MCGLAQGEVTVHIVCIGVIVTGESVRDNAHING